MLIYYTFSTYKALCYALYAAGLEYTFQNK